MQKFNYHSHTFRCRHADLDLMDEEYIQEYIQMGFEKIAFTDHCPQKNKIDQRDRMRMDYDQKEEYLNSIRKLKEKYAKQIEIEVGFEVEYLPDDVENLRELKGECDKLILGQHFIYDDDHRLKILGLNDFTDEELLRYAQYVEKAMELNIPDIIAHPDFYMMKRKGFGEIEREVAKIICQAAETYQIPLEINLNHIFSKTYYENRKLNHDSLEIQRGRLKEVAYPCKEFWDIASHYNIQVLYGIDAHHRGQILKWHDLVTLANEIIQEDVVSRLNFIEK